MPNADLLLYLVHLGFWGTIGATRLVLRRGEAASGPVSPPEPSAAGETTARFSRALIVFHSVAFGVLYFGVGNAVIPGRVPNWFPGQRLVGTAIIAAGAALAGWAIASFHSWRFRAKLEPGHRLARGGPFRFVRHPIYLGLNLLALGTAVWVPTVLVWIGAVLMLVGSDLRARTEERLLIGVFGPVYSEYMTETRRFIPGIY